MSAREALAILLAGPGAARRRAHPCPGVPAAMRADPREPAAVVAGGVLGVLARASLGEALPAATGPWPWANVTRAALVGWIVTHLDHRTAAGANIGVSLALGLALAWPGREIGAAL